jgi:hypothetical protein
MIGVARSLMGMGDLNHGQKSQQNHTHHCDDRKGARPQAAGGCV